MYPFTQNKVGSSLIREFGFDVDDKELVWHRDREDRAVKVISGDGWLLQMENCLPERLVPGRTYLIEAETYHRVIKGNNSLVLEITESDALQTLRSVIREEIGRNMRTLDNDPYNWEDYKDVEVETWVDPSSNRHFAKVECVSDPSLSAGEKSFSDEHSASHWARMQSERIMKATINKIS